MRELKYENLAACGVADLQRRFKIIQGEIDHLVRAISSSDGKKDETEEVDEAGIESDDDRFLTKLKEAAQIVRADVRKYKDQVDQLHELLLIHPNQIEPVSIGQLLAYEQASFRLRANVLVERMGSLHDRLDQFLERSNPDHPGPTRRRRAEQGIQDKYLNELATWIYRDIAIVSSSRECLGERYPYSEAPPTFQFWDYERSSRHHSFLSSDGQDKWLSWYEDGQVEKARKTTDAANSSSDRKQKFTALRLSYWMPECNELHPIIAHELAHQVIRDIYGYETGRGDLEVGGHGLSRTLRRVHQCIEAWTADDQRENLGKWHPIPTELLCDAFATARCGPAFAYAQFLEFLDNEAFADLCKDHNGLLGKSIMEFLPRKKKEGESEREREERGIRWKNRLREMKFQARTLSDSSIGWLLRLSVTVQLASKLFRPKEKSIDQALLSELSQYVDDMLGLYSMWSMSEVDVHSKDTAYYKSVKALSNDIVHAFLNSGRFSEKTEFWKAVDSFWKLDELGYRENHFLYRQSLGACWYRAFGSRLPNQFGNERCSGQNVSSIDLPWMFAWKNASDWIVKRKSGSISKFTTEQINALDSARELYLYRTFDPRFAVAGLGIKLADETVAWLRMVGGEASLKSQQQKLAHQYWKELITLLSTEEGIHKFMHSGFRTGKLSAEPDDTFGEIWMKGSGSVELPAIRLGFESKSLEEWFQAGKRKKLHLLSLAYSGKKESYQKFDKLERCDPSKVAVVLGRYDAYALHVSDEKSADSFDKEMKGINHRRRSRNLVVAETVNLNESIEDGSRYLAVVLLSARWSGYRLPCLDHIKSVAKSFEALGVKVCLSDGWEDLVLLIAPSGEMGSSAVSEINLRSVDELAQFVEKLNMSPLISATETIFVREALPIFESREETKISIQCRIASKGSKFIGVEDLKSRICEGMPEYLRGDLSIEVKRQYGILDYSIVISNRSEPLEIGQAHDSESDTKAVLNVLYGIEEIERIETQVLL